MPTLRRCVACRNLLDRQHLLRVIRLAQGEGLALDQGMGRSAYVCPRLECLEEARQRRRLQRALRTAIPDRIYEALAERVSPGGTSLSGNMNTVPSL
jgi:predicted RNA-binding protein YlxR (DUF448 family)